MTTVALTRRPAVSGRFSDVWAMTRRNLVHISREPMQLSDVTVQPVLFTVLFIYIFGGGIPIPGGGSYKDFAVAGLLAAHSRFGRCPLSRVLAPAVNLAENGFVIGPDLHDALGRQS